MATVAATGHSRKVDAYRAGVEAAQMAMEVEASPNQIVLFSSIVHDPVQVLEGVRSVVEGVPIVGGSAFGEISNHGMRNHSVALMAIRSDQIDFRTAVGHGKPDERINPGRAAAEQALDLMGDRAPSDTRMGVFVSEMLGTDKTLLGIQSVLGREHRLFGGCCSGNRYASIRDADFVLGYQYVDDQVYRHSVPLLLMSGEYRTVFGVSHGWRSYGPVERIGRCSDNVIYEIGDTSAAEFYERYLGKGSYTPYPLAFKENDKLVLRAVTGTAEGGGLRFTTGIPEGTDVRITRGSRTDILRSVQEATQDALDQLGDRKPRFGFVISCISRHMMLGSRVTRELEEVQEVLGTQLPLVGFYAAGEYSPVGNVCFYHNLTFCICLIADDREDASTEEVQIPAVHEKTDVSRVLLVCRDAALAEHIGDLLQAGEYEFSHRESGEDVHRLLRRFVPHVVLIDVDHLELLDSIHSIDATVQVIVLVRDEQLERVSDEYDDLQKQHRNLFGLAGVGSARFPLKVLIDSAAGVCRKADVFQTTQVELEEALRMLRHSEDSIETTETMLTESYKTVEGAKEDLERKVDELNEAYRKLENTHTQLRDAQQQLLDASRRAGMADIAAEVLHHVGNELNSLTVSIDTIMEGLSDSRLVVLRQVVDMLQANADDLTRFVREDEKGRHLLPFLDELTGRLSAEREKTISESLQIQQQVDTVLRAVSQQQERARGGAYFELCDASQIIDEARRFVQESFAMNHVTLKTVCSEDVQLTLDRHRVIQILISLLSNAEQAVASSDASHGEVILAVMVVTVEETEYVTFSVSDNGVGIPHESLKKIFAKGYTTKENHQGFGLHDAANAANAMGGKVECSSSGEGRGAVFSLIVPRDASKGTPETGGD